MTRFLSGLSLFLFYCFAHAETAAETVPDEPTNMVGVIIFGVLFVGFCVGFMWMVYSADKKKTKDGGAKTQDAPSKTT
jgi:hypothetical protein